MNPMLSALLLSILVVARAQPTAGVGTTPFVIDGNRIYARLSFIRADGSRRPAYAFVDMGRPSMDIKKQLFEDLHADAGRGLSFDIGGMRVDVPASIVRREGGTAYSLGRGKRVEAVLPASVLSRYDVVIDYAARTLTLATPGTIRAVGTRVPFHLNTETGLIAVDAAIAGSQYAITIDNGSAYTWLRADSSKAWLAKDSRWQRGVGAVGPANMTMAGDETEASGIMLRIPRVAVGALTIDDVGALAVNGGRGATPGQGLMDWYSTKNAVPVIGWIGGNVLRHYRLTLDYSHHAMYWFRQSPQDANELHQIGLTLRARQGDYYVAAIATRLGAPAVSGVVAGDKLLRVGDLVASGATLGQIYAAMHGAPGERRIIVVERDGRPVRVDAAITAF
jgi:hypothetical protein